MTPAYSPSHNSCVLDWLHRANDHYKEGTPEKIKAADYDRAKQSLGLAGNITNNYYFSPSRPAHSGINIGNSSTTTHHTTNIYNTSADSSKPKNKNPKETEEKNPTGKA